MDKWLVQDATSPSLMTCLGWSPERPWVQVVIANWWMGVNISRVEPQLLRHFFRRLLFRPNNLSLAHTCNWVARKWSSISWATSYLKGFPNWTESPLKNKGLHQNNYLLLAGGPSQQDFRKLFSQCKSKFCIGVTFQRWVCVVCGSIGLNHNVIDQTE